MIFIPCKEFSNVCVAKDLDLSNAESMSREDLYNYLMVLYKLVPQLQVFNDEILGDDSDSEEEDMDMDDQVKKSSLNIEERNNLCMIK